MSFDACMECSVIKRFPGLHGCDRESRCPGINRETSKDIERKKNSGGRDGLDRNVLCLNE
ncbi:b68.2 [miniopterid betaherpesvirus 1]|uniref:B68.2 n=1 Tax=miniopterid betaherpesvirus 1 TaxID=3070189 RepID=I3VQ58_9BETA|nr:b68.2 [miniopterid betaherpesvirus 1]AFK83902.1 b68.2 [miniopterid betaherpesvirus 1]